MELMGDAERSSAARVTARRFLQDDPQDRGALRQGNIALIHSAPTGDDGEPSFRGDAKHRTRNIEIPGLVLAHHPGMTSPVRQRSMPGMNLLHRGELLRGSCALMFRLPLLIGHAVDGLA